ncbi:MAG: hypothetical protein EU549_02470 [Promethearchaeota archaeon]|nr:MAG: hypothetical protein EU549_02470 [Candidatus Lokiarchaeota archaeon]
MIQNLVILKRSGENIYNKNIGNVNMNETVMSGFFSAFFVFSQELCNADIKTIQIGNLYKAVFETSYDEKLIFVAICDISDSLMVIKEVLNKVKGFTFEQFGNEIKEKGCNLDCNNQLNTFIEDILSESQELEISEDLLNKYNDILKDLDRNSEILDSALISSTGVTSTSDKDKEFLNLVIKQMEAFFNLTGRNLDEIILKFQNRHIILYRINEELVLSSLTKRNIPIGVATLLIEEAASEISKLSINK